MHAKSILAILTTVAACGVSVMAGPIATDSSSELIERGFDDSEALLELVERDLIDSPTDIEARSFDDEEVSARELEDIDAREISEVTVDLEAREPGRGRGGGGRGGRGRGGRGRGGRGRGGRGRGRRGRGGRGRGGRRGGGAPPQEEAPAAEEAAPVEGRSLRNRIRALTPLTQKQQTRVAALDNSCKAIVDKKTNRRCNRLVSRLRNSMSHRNYLIAEITKMSTPTAQ